MPRDRDEDTQQFEPDYTDREFLNAVAELATDTSLPSTSEVADFVGCHRDTARPRLRALADDGQLGRVIVHDTDAWKPID